MTAPLIGEDMTAPLAHPYKTYDAVVSRLKIEPNQVYERCEALVRFDYGSSNNRPAATLPPRVGQKPISRKRKKNTR